MRRSTITTVWSPEEAAERSIEQPRDDVVDEAPPEVGDAHADSDALVFEQARGPFREYRRAVHTDPATGRVHEQTTYALDIPYFAWAFRRLMERSITRRASSGERNAWAPTDRLDARQVHMLGLLAGAGLIAAFTNTLFTQTVNQAADTFGISEGGQGVAGTIVRLGAVIVIPFAMFADRVGRRRVLVMMSFLAPGVCALGALAPTFAVLTATQAIGRPLGLALSVMIGVVLAEEMPAGSRAFALSVVTMAAGLGATVAVAPLFLGDVFSQGWRLIYVLALGFWWIAARLRRELPETRRFEVHEEHEHVDPADAQAAHAANRRLVVKRFAIIATVSILGNIFVAPASFFQNRYLEDVRGFAGWQISLFTILTATPAGLGLLLGGKLAERGRRLLVITLLPVSCLLLVGSFNTGGPLMWLASLFGGVLGGMVYPALVVYRGEMFPTGRRGGLNGAITFLSLLGGVVGLLACGHLVDDADWSYGQVMLLLSVGQLLAAVVVWFAYPETARMELEALNPEDAADLSVTQPSR